MSLRSVLAVTVALVAAACGDAKLTCADGVFVTLKPGDRAMLGGEEMAIGAIAPAIAARYADATECRVMIRADRTVAYGDFMRFADALERDGFHKITLVAEEVLTP